MKAWLNLFLLLLWASPALAATPPKLSPEPLIIQLADLSPEYHRFRGTPREGTGPEIMIFFVNKTQREISALARAGQSRPVHVMDKEKFIVKARSMGEVVSTSIPGGKRYGLILQFASVQDADTFVNALRPSLK
ncbi:MAG: hypothetical protein AB1705_04355 [Verrucomicrobiota bacterium]